MSPTNAIHRSNSRPQLDVSRAVIQANSEDRNPTILLPNQSDDISHLALDIGGSLIKLVYFSRHEEQQSNDDRRKKSLKLKLEIPNGHHRRNYPVLGGRLHFVKFETRKINECLDFISSKQLHYGDRSSSAAIAAAQSSGENSSPMASHRIVMESPKSVVLTDDNYFSWRAAFHVAITGLNLVHHLDGNVALLPDSIELQQDQLILSWILTAVSPKIQPKIASLSTSALMWHKLERIYAGGSETRILNLSHKLRSIKKGSMLVEDYINLINSMNDQLTAAGIDSPRVNQQFDDNIVIKATGGGAYKYADLFKEKLGISIDKKDEMDCLVAGANFLLKAIRGEAYTHMEGQKEFVHIDQNDLFPYLLVNIGSGVSMIKVDGDGKFERVSGTNVGGGTYLGLGKLLTKCKSFDELLELTQRGNNSNVDMLVGDIYGGLNYSKIGLSASAIASSFGKTISDNKELSDYNPEDISLALLRMISYNIGQISYLIALREGLKRIFFGGFFIRGHAYTMDTISFAVDYWSKGQSKAMFLRHEGFLGAIGAFMSYEKHGLDDLMAHQLVERFPTCSPYMIEQTCSPSLIDLNEKISWIEKFMQKSTEITAPVPMTIPGTTGIGGFDSPSSRGNKLRSDGSAGLFNIGVLHLVPTLEVFPLLADPKTYDPDTIDLSELTELKYWLTVLSEHLPDLVDKAVASEGGTDEAKRRGDAFARAFSSHLARLMEEPAAYGKFGLANLLELREECLREFHFKDAYVTIKKRENEASLAVLPDLLVELDSMNEEGRLHSIIEGVLAANIFDWGSRACVNLYHKGTIIDIYRMSRKKMHRPWQVDDYDLFKERMFVCGSNKPYKRALLFVDNSGADVVLGMLPLARELLQRGTEVVLVGNSLPALNDVTANELPGIVAEAAKHCDIIRKAAEAGGLLVDVMATQDSSKEKSNSVPLMVVENGGGSPCIDFRQVSSELAAVAKDADLVILEGMGRSLHTNFNARFKCDTLKLAMVKNQRLAEKLVKGNIYDCVCKFEPAVSGVF